MFRHVRIKNKLALVMTALSCIVIGIFSTLFYLQFEIALKERVLLQLSSVKKLKVVQIENVINSRVEAIKHLLAQSDSTYNQQFFNSVVYLKSPGSVHINSYELTLPDTLNQGNIFIKDLSPENDEGFATLAFMAYNSGQYLVCIDTLTEIQSILLERTGLGQSGESYLVGEDYTMRSTSRFFPDKNPTTILARTSGAVRALRGETGEGIILDYRGVSVFSAFEKIAINGLEWVILSEIDYQEALFPLKSLRRNFYIMLVIMLAFVLLASYQLARLLVKPILRMEQYLNTMSRGVILEPQKDVDRNDEIGGMFRALDKLTTALQQTIEFAGRIGEGNFSANYQLLSEEDTLGAALLQMKQKLRDYQKNEERLLKENQQSIINGEEQERSRLSKEIHDGLGPLLTSLRLSIQAIPLEETHKKQLLKTLDDTITETRRMANNLMPSVLEDFGAGEAIKNLVIQLDQSSPLDIRYNQDTLEESKIPQKVNIVLYRIAQEALNNAIRHAQATEIRLSLTEFDEHVSLFISDNGSGFDQSTVLPGNGLRNMRERARLVDGSLVIYSDANGTSIEVEIPF
ncbi:two-component system NarL family sensor kinase [Catalinimonas alkaloidigena]|uniref:sensor histidine kinase n=1 Tax=Catalinimonas alkaloidigena TaxID=1075417 RepID=UPI0024060899|nr:ATP-binding protein [Catalinimonas alkaloidigena]MDF9795717.1 two-component system NarL family sensor kinase [Catalinimonas alkaloidigena]